MMKDRTHIIAALVEHKPGVLYSVSNMFRRRGFNIESITVGATEQLGRARITMTVKSDEKTVEQVIKQLNKLIDVIKVSRLDPFNIVVRELALLKVHTSSTRARSDVINYADIFRARVVDVSYESLMIEITGDPNKIDAFIDLMNPFGIKELARTGITSLTRGVKSIIIQ